MDQRGRWPDLAFDRPLAALQEEPTPSRLRTITPHGVRRCGGPDSPRGSREFFCGQGAAPSWRRPQTDPACPSSRITPLGEKQIGKRFAILCYFASNPWKLLQELKEP